MEMRNRENPDDMEQTHQQEEFNLNISPAAVAFLVLVALMALIGLYVNNIEVESSGATAIESELPFVLEDNVTGLTLRYPEQWEASSQNGLLVLRPVDDELGVTSISVERRETDFDTVVAEEIGLPEEEEFDAFNRDNVTGVRDDASAVVDDVDVEIRTIVFSEENDDVYVARLQAPPGDFSAYAQRFDFLVQTVSSIQPYALTNVAERASIGLSIAYPDGWEDVRQLQSPDLINLEEQPNSQDGQAILIDLVPGELIAPGLPEGTAVSPTSILELILATNEGLIPLTEIEPLSVGGFAGAQVDIGTTAAPDVFFRIISLDATDGNFIQLQSRLSIDDAYRMNLTLQGMLESIAYANLQTPADDVNEIRDGEEVTETDDAAEAESTEDAETDVESEDGATEAEGFGEEQGDTPAEATTETEDESTDAAGDSEAEPETTTE